MKRYALFAYEVCYPAGGFDDFIVAGNDIDQLCVEASACSVGGYNESPSFATIVDLHTMSRVKELSGSGEWKDCSRPPTRSWSYDRDLTEST